MSLFDPNRPINSAISLITTYPSLNINDIAIQSASYIGGSCTPTSSSNVTYVIDNMKYEYKAVQLWIVGSAPGSTYSLHNIEGLENITGELIIRNVNINGGEETLYMCYPLTSILEMGTLTGSSTSQVDLIINAASNANVSAGANAVTVNLNADISPNGANSKYVVYNSKGATVVVYTKPISISTSVFQLQNNLSYFDMYSANYNIVSANMEGSWMECEYVPLDSEEVVSYNLPLSSGILKDSSTFQSFRTVILFIVFSFICLFAYMLVPHIYLAIVGLWIGKNYVTTTEKKSKIRQVDYILSGLLGGLGFLLICIGVSSSAPNSSDVLLSGICIGIIYLISYLIIQAKKSTGGFIEGL